MKKGNNMSTIRTIASCLLATFLLFGCENSEMTETPSEAENFISYELVENWPNLPEGFALGMPTGLGIDSDNNIVVFHRAGRPWAHPAPEEKIDRNTIFTIDSKTGEVLKNWGADLFLMPHGLEVDQDNNIWVTDTGLHQVLKFNSDGDLLMTIGEEKVMGNDSSHFALPTDVGVASDGSFYVSDGYGNSRVVKFSKDGSFLFEWGDNGPDRKLNRGTKDGQFDTPHGIDLDKDGNIYVADRENNRIQKFNSAGNFIAIWQNDLADQFYSLVIDKKNARLFGVDFMNQNDTALGGSDIFSFDLDLNLEQRFGRTGFYDGPTSRYHDIAIDDDGNIYVGDIRNNTIQKFQLKSEQTDNPQ
jgi:peptidylamidoglycolate lyase